MAANVELSGFTSVQYVSFFQGSDSRPGRCVVELVTSEDGIVDMPRHTTLTISTDTFSGTWPDMRVVKAARVGHLRMRLTLEDDRWKLWETTMSRNYNNRDAGGNVMTASLKYLDELVAELASATGLTITTGALPGFLPPAKWIGRSAGECMKDLLLHTGCRLVYSPASQNYTFSAAGSGSADLSAGQGLYQPPPGNRFSTVTFKSEPILFEKKLPCTAKLLDWTTGEPVDVGDGDTLPKSPTEPDGQLRYRLWVPDVTGEEERLYLDKRAMAHMYDPISPTRESARIVRDSFERYPHHEPLVQEHGPLVKVMELTGGGVGFVTRNPVMIAEAGGKLSRSCEIVTSYHELDEEGKMKRLTKDVDTGGTGGEHTVYVDWIKPVDSDQEDVPASLWDTVLDEASQAMSAMYKNDPRVMYLPEPKDFGGDGRIGAMKYHLRITSRPMIYAIACINFSPGSLGDLG